MYNPVAPTPQLMSMMRTLEKKHGPVRHIILGTVALEHKVSWIFTKKMSHVWIWVPLMLYAYQFSFYYTFRQRLDHLHNIFPMLQFGCNQDRYVSNSLLSYQLVMNLSWQSSSVYNDILLVGIPYQSTNWIIRSNSTWVKTSWNSKIKWYQRYIKTV